MYYLLGIGLLVALFVLFVLGTQLRTFTGTQISIVNEFPENTTTNSENWFNFKVGDITGDITSKIKLRGASLQINGSRAGATVSDSFDFFIQLHRVPELFEERGLLFQWSGNISNFILATGEEGHAQLNDSYQMLDDGDYFKLDPDDVIFVNVSLTNKDAVAAHDAIFRAILTLYYIPVGK